MEELVELQRARARAEHAEWDAMLTHASTEVERIAESATAFIRKMGYRALVVDLALKLHLHERRVRARLREGQRLRNELKLTWEAFSIGDLDARAASLIAQASERLSDPRNVERLDHRAAVYAPRHTRSELRRWLDLLVRRLEPVDEAEAACARDARRVDIDHGDDGMSWVNAYLPTAAAAAIDRRLDAVASTMPDDDPDYGGRTLPQRRADLVAAWLTNNENLAPGALSVDLAIVNDNGLYRSPDGDWTIPPAVAEDLTTQTPGATVRELDLAALIRSSARFLTGRGRALVQYRDGHCQVPGCGRKATGCDIDHRVPHPEGETSTVNCWALCRYHHRLKGLGYLTPVQQYGRWAWRLRDGTIIGGPEPPPPVSDRFDELEVCMLEYEGATHASA